MQMVEPQPATATDHAPDGFDAWAAACAQRIRDLIERHVPPGDGPSPVLSDAMHYAAALGGKRVRPMLVWAVGVCVDGDAVALDAAACAVEFIHAYSLVHDDLPCMDNDVLRRGLPTAHVKFGEAMALLAGDALQARAFEVVACDEAIAPGLRARLCALLAAAAGAQGMAGGQAVDLTATGRVLSAEALSDMHRRKTGALLAASVRMGLACARALSPEQVAACARSLEAYAGAIGLAFQVVDDVLDASADSATLGKTAGKDAQQNKATFVTAMGLDAARDLARRLQDEAQDALSALPPIQRARAGHLSELARRIVARGH